MVARPVSEVWLLQQLLKLFLGLCPADLREMKIQQQLSHKDAEKLGKRTKKLVFF